MGNFIYFYMFETLYLNFHKLCTVRPRFCLTSVLLNLKQSNSSCQNPIQRSYCSRIFKCLQNLHINFLLFFCYNFVCFRPNTVMAPNKVIVFTTSAFELIFIYLKLNIFQFQIWKYSGEFFRNLFLRRNWAFCFKN